MEVHIPIIGFHYDEEIFPDPPTFDPERLTAEAVAERHPMAFMPYGQGLRNCFRFKFALLLAKVPTSCTVQGGAGGLAVGWVDLDLECSTILLGQ